MTMTRTASTSLMLKVTVLLLLVSVVTTCTYQEWNSIVSSFMLTILTIMQDGEEPRSAIVSGVTLESPGTVPRL